LIGGCGPTLACVYSACHAAMGSSTAVFSSRLCSTAQHMPVQYRARRARLLIERSMSVSTRGNTHVWNDVRDQIPEHSGWAARMVTAGRMVPSSVCIVRLQQPCVTHVGSPQLACRHETRAGAGDGDGRAGGALVPHAGHRTRQHLVRGVHDACRAPARTDGQIIARAARKDGWRGAPAYRSYQRAYGSPAPSVAFFKVLMLFSQLARRRENAVASSNTAAGSSNSLRTVS